MIKLILNYLDINRIHYAFMIIELCILFFLFSSYVDEVVKNTRLIEYCDFLDDNMILAKCPSKDLLLQYIEEYGDNGIGYIYSDILSNFNESYLCWYASECFSSNAVKVKCGRNLSYDKQKNEAIIFGNALNEKYKIGNCIELGGQSYEIVGSMGSYDLILNLQNYYTNEMDISELSITAYNGNMILLNNKKFSNNYNLPESIITYYKEAAGNRGIGLSDIKKTSKHIIIEKRRYNLAGIIMLFVLFIFSVWSLSVIERKRCAKILSLYYVSGLSKTRYIFMCMTVDIIILFIAVFIYTLLYLSGMFTEVFFVDNTIGIWCIYSCFILVIPLLIYNIFYHCIVTRKSILELMREYE